MRVNSVQHVSVGIAAGREDEARWFYSQVLGLTEKKPPIGLKHLALIWFAVGDGDGEIHLVCTDPENFGPSRAGDHFCLAVDDIAACRQRFGQNRVPIREASPVNNRPRFFVQDPFQNLLEVVQILGPYEPMNT